MIVKDKLTGRTLEVKDNEKKKLEILLYAGWVVVEDEKPAKKENEKEEVVSPQIVTATPDLISVAPVEEPVIVEPEFSPVTEPLVGEIATDESELPLPATEPRKARLHAPKVKKTLKLPDDYA